MADEIPELNLQRLTDELEAAVELAAALSDDTLTHLAAAIRDEIRRRAREGGNHDAIIEEAFQQAFGRDPEPWEAEAAVGFIEAQKKETGNDSLKQPLTDLCHTLFNVKEFVFVN